MSNNAIVKIFIDHNPQRVRSLLPIPHWAEQAAGTPEGWLCPPSDVVQAHLGRPLLDAAQLVPPPADRREAYAQRGAEALDDAWLHANWGFDRELYVGQVATQRSGALELLCLWVGVGSDTIGPVLFRCFSEAASRLGVHFRVLYAEESCDRTGRIDTAAGSHQAYAGGSMEEEELVAQLGEQWFAWTVFWMRWSHAHGSATPPWGPA